MKSLYVVLLFLSLLTLFWPTFYGLQVTGGEQERQRVTYSDDGRRYVIVPAGGHMDPESADVSGSSVGSMGVLEGLSTCCLVNSNRFFEDPGILTEQLLPVLERVGWLEKGTLTDSSSQKSGERRAPDLVSDGKFSLEDISELLRVGNHDALMVAFLEHGGVVSPVVVIDVNEVFVTVDEPGVGRALYRRRAFDKAWTGHTVEFTRAGAGVEPTP